MALSKSKKPALVRKKRASGMNRQEARQLAAQITRAYARSGNYPDVAANNIASRFSVVYSSLLDSIIAKG